MAKRNRKYKQRLKQASPKRLKHINYLLYKDKHVKNAYAHVKKRFNERIGVKLDMIDISRLSTYVSRLWQHDKVLNMPPRRGEKTYIIRYVDRYIVVGYNTKLELVCTVLQEMKGGIKRFEKITNLEIGQVDLDTMAEMIANMDDENNAIAVGIFYFEENDPNANYEW